MGIDAFEMISGRGPQRRSQRRCTGVLHLLGVPVDPTAVGGRNLFSADAEEDRAVYIETLSPLLDYGWAPLRGLRRLGRWRLCALRNCGSNCGGRRG